MLYQHGRCCAWVKLEIPTIGGKAKVKIEEGTQSGKILRLRGKGLPSVNGYGTGDLLVHINVWTPQNLSKRRNHSLKNVENLKVSAPIQHKKINPFLTA